MKIKVEGSFSNGFKMFRATPADVLIRQFGHSDRLVEILDIEPPINHENPETGYDVQGEYIVIKGDILHGIQAIGPFSSGLLASEYADKKVEYPRWNVFPIINDDPSESLQAKKHKTHC